MFRFPIIRFVSFAFVILSSSCINLRKNYLGSAERNLVITKLNDIQITRLDSSRKLIDKKMDSLVLALSDKKRLRHYYANEINQLFSGLGTQLDYDRIFNSLLQRGGRKRDRLSSTQRYAAVCLLMSAEVFDKSFQRHRKIRRMLNRGESGNKIPKNVLQKSRKFLYSPTIRKILLAQNNGARPDLSDTLLNQLPKTNFLKSTWVRLYRKNDRLVNPTYGLVTFIGRKIFGAGIAKTSIRAEQRRNAVKLASVIQPFDILLSRDASHLSAKVIPGYFGHAAIWLGDKAPSKRKRVINLFKKTKNEIPKISSNSIIESLRSGVDVSNLKKFSEGEVFLIIRPRNLSSEQKQSVLSNAGKQMGKAYDFNFDIESPDVVNCTELVYLAYDFISWKVRYFLGRNTILPDDILLTTFGDERFEFPGVLKKGELILNPDSSFLRALINK